MNKKKSYVDYWLEQPKIYAKKVQILPRSLAVSLAVGYAIKFVPLSLPLTLPPFTCDTNIKIMGISCHDMDIALDTIMGFEFASHLHQYVNEELKDPEILGHHGSIGKIKSNPDKSKHLETATARIFGLDVDFVNLRSETYQEECRIPNIEFGTPLQDAQRRDLTINSLFYNLHTRSIEDFLGNGLQDLRDGLIRTPLSPYETFKDDPLRILRCIRFASRFNYKISPNIPLALQNPEIKKLLGSVISKERVGDEITKMMSRSSCLDSVRYFLDFNLYPIVFELPAAILNTPFSIYTSLEKLENFSRILKTDFGERILKMLGSMEKKDWVIINLSLSMFPYENLTYIESKRNLKRHAAYHVCRNSLKLPLIECESVETLHSKRENYEKILSRVSSFNLANEEERKSCRLELGLFLRDLGLPPLKGNLWIMFLYAGSLSENVEESVNKGSRLLDIIYALGLVKAHEMLPALDGKQIVQIAKDMSHGVPIYPGPWVGAVRELIIRMQLFEGEQLNSKDEIATRAVKIVEEFISSGQVDMETRKKPRTE